MGARAEFLGKLSSGAELVRASCELDEAALSEDRPRWIHILPGGTKVEARDGRRFTVESHDDVVSATELPMLIDWEHASESGDTRAAGWVEELRVEPPAAGDRAGIWGRAAWTDRGEGDVRAKQFRYLSPVVVGKRDLQTFAVKSLRSVALTNRPALRMHGIESFRAQLSQQLGPIATEPKDMNEATRKALCTAFGLQADATDDDLATAAVPLVEAVKKTGDSASLRTACAALTQDLNTERSRASQLETELATFKDGALKTEIEAFFDKGARDGKIPPAAREKWLAFCLESAPNFETFKSVIFPELVPIKPGKAAASKPPAHSSASKFTDKSPHGVNRSALKAMGFSEEQILESERDLYERKTKGRDDDDEDDDDEDDDDEEGTGS